LSGAKWHQEINERPEHITILKEPQGPDDSISYRMAQDYIALFGLGTKITTVTGGEIQATFAEFFMKAIEEEIQKRKS